MGLYLKFDQLVTPGERERYRDLVKQRARDRIPVAYLTGVREFWSRSFEVSPETLIPRPDTELLVQTLIDLRPRRFVDVGTGCAAVAASVALELPEVRAVAVDAVERLVAALEAEGTKTTAQALDYRLWSRGQSPTIKARPRHRTRCTFY